MVRRWEDLATRSDVYNKWHKSEQAKKFTDECKLAPICKTIFWENVCPCCRFGMKDMCADQVMTGLEESRSRFEKALRDSVLSKAAFLCQCPYHQNERTHVLNSCTVEDESKASEWEQAFEDDSSGSDDSGDSDGNIDYRRAFSKSPLGALLRQQGENIISQSCCPAKQYPELKRHSNVESKQKIPEFIHLNCVMGKC